ncbi:RNA-directed DNA polymerase (Reverse transcriptase) [Desulfosarcina cetonica]|uniref:reverse transcriptase domain-containing protein n=1 Tax=Desulfosarcina cetonica TaxID=90730 RepID=UPI0006D1CB55|nr:reverse transcriptase domain-containing protein [Desulfosarcina cetonica]VTR70771.1 RNA-directed DNA polymerase (Reverse transcriptase) [Desulfosarcina cetonica]
MKRLRIDLEDIAGFHNLAKAAKNAARAKRHRPEVQTFFHCLDHNLNQLSRDILAGRVPEGEFKQFRIFDPKERIIHAACFKDRVLHHAIMNLAGPLIDRAMVASSFACRPDKGIHCGIRHVQSKLRKYPWYVKIDIEHYFDTIDQRLLLQLLERRFKGENFMALVGRIISGYQTLPGKGLPIGSLASQHFANYYLDGLDRHLMETLKAFAHARYMDDVVWWCMDKQAAGRTLAAVEAYLRERRSLRVKPSSVQINQSRRGIRFCGFRVLPGAIRLGARRKRRYGALRRKWEGLFISGTIDAKKLQQGYAAVHAMTQHADSMQWRKNHLERSVTIEA